MRRIRDHLTYANVMATLAVFLVLSGGTAVALNGANTVQSDDLGPGAQVQAADVAANAVGTADVINESLTSADVANGQLNDEDVGQGTFVNFTGAIGNVPALGCVEKPITGVNATGDHLLLTPNWNTQSTQLVYSAESHISDPNVTIQVCNPTPSAIDDGNTNFNLLVIDAH